MEFTSLKPYPLALQTTKDDDEHLKIWGTFIQTPGDHDLLATSCEQISADVN
ncbi:hypothetical protein P5673_009040 [Acropora cervicornis]|uniref:Uncharacterized protein n=1 Tax=Acropora cervicornis TaxID=6130 RepID=A0AAD9VAH9_ACRCE|nr:hypothetical protein P5673_009040 [Acropora cervicornis]